MATRSTHPSTQGCQTLRPDPIPPEIRLQILDAARLAPSSFNTQPYRFIWIESPEIRKQAAHLCMSQSPAETASALVVAVADIGSWRSTHKATSNGCVPPASAPKKSPSGRKNPALPNGFSCRVGLDALAI